MTSDRDRNDAGVNRRKVLECMTWAGAGALVFSAMAAPAPAWAAETEVKIENFTFNPPRLTVKAGTTVRWLNEDDIPHTVASSTKVFRSKALDTNDTFSFTFATPGVYEYFCSLHPHMTATITVEAAVGGGPR